MRGVSRLGLRMSAALESMPGQGRDDREEALGQVLLEEHPVDLPRYGQFGLELRKTADSTRPPM